MQKLILKWYISFVGWKEKRKKKNKMEIEISELTQKLRCNMIALERFRKRFSADLPEDISVEQLKSEIVEVNTNKKYSNM